MPVSRETAAGLATGVLTTVIGALGHIEPLWSLLVSTSGVWFSVIAVVSGPLAARVEFIPQGIADFVFTAAIVLFVGVGIFKLQQAARRRF